VAISALTMALAIPQLFGAQAAGATGGSSSGGWLLAGTAQLAQDPENSQNDVIKIRTDVAPFFGQVSRTVNVKVNKLDNMLEFKARFTSPKTCTGGSPRLQLAIDADGDGDSDGNAFGFFGSPATSFTGCPQNTWLYEDLTGGGDGTITGGPLFPSPPQMLPLNEELEWDLIEFGELLPKSWSDVEAFFAMHPNHLVCTVALVDDVPAGLPIPLPGSAGTAHYDVISGGRATWVDGSDIAGYGMAQGCNRQDRPDDGPYGDKDHDGDHDGHDDQFDQYRKQRWG
jgi:hypothetical protein